MSAGAPVGTRIGPYEIVGWLGAGGMGDVYRARDTRLSRDVAVKLVAADLAVDAGRVRRFEQEARAAGQLNHPNILAVYDTGIHDGRPYIVSELLEGESLRSRLTRGALPIRKALEVARQIADGLAAAHDKDIVHRDVKPDNVFITADGRIKLLDFGIAKLSAPLDSAARQTGFPTDTTPGMVVGTAAYMSPEQVRGETVDARSDIFSLGAVLYEAIAGRSAFARDTAAETMTAILNDDPAEPAALQEAPALSRIVFRCLEKRREARYQSARDLAFGLDVLTGTQSTAASAASVRSARRAWPAIAMAGVIVAAVAAGWLARPVPPPPDNPGNPLEGAKFSPVTDWPGNELGAEISPDGRYVAFVADRDGELDLWITQVGTGVFHNLTPDRPSLVMPGDILRTFGFSGDGSEVWLSIDQDAAGRKVRMPITGGPAQPFLAEKDASPAWSPDDTRVVYMNNRDGDPFYVGSRSAADAQPITHETGGHNHNPAWSPDGEWIYFVHGAEPSGDMEIWRLHPDGTARQQLSGPLTALNFFTVLDRRTLLYVARDADRSGPWLWTFDVPTRTSRRAVTGLSRFTRVAASRDGRRIVAASPTPTTSLWRVPILGRLADEADAAPYRLPTERALAPRFRGQTLFYLTARGGSDDGLWRVDPGDRLSQVWNGTDGALSEPAAVSSDGARVAVVRREGARRRLMIMDADGTHARTLAATIDIQGAAGQGAVDWSPDGQTIVAGGIDATGPALFLIPADGGAPRRLLNERAESPVWSPDGKLILYSGPFITGQSDMLAVRPDGTRVDMPHVRVRQGGYRFLPDSRRIVYLERIPVQDFWMLDLATKETRPLTRFKRQASVQTFDIAPDGASIVFDVTRANSDIVLIDLPKPAAAPAQQQR